MFDLNRTDRDPLDTDRIGGPIPFSRSHRRPDRDLDLVGPVLFQEGTKDRYTEIVSQALSSFRGQLSSMWVVPTIFILEVYYIM